MRLGMFIAEFQAIDFPVFVIQSSFAAGRVFAYEMFNVITITVMGYSALAFYRKAAAGRSAQGVIRFVIMIITKWFAVKDIERFVGEGFLD